MSKLSFIIKSILVAGGIFAILIGMVCYKAGLNPNIATGIIYSGAGSSTLGFIIIKLTNKESGSL